MTADLITGAQFSPCRTWRYALWRIWANQTNPEGLGRYVAFIGLNPSTADETANDPTVTRCVNYARAWGYDGLYMLNIFAYRATDPKDMRAAADPIGPHNDNAIMMTCSMMELVVAAWGTYGEYRNRAKHVEQLLLEYKRQVHCLGVTKHGYPRHPLYVRKDLMPTGLREAREAQK